MLKYVGEEVDRVKGLFEQKEARLVGERDSAKQAAAQLASELKVKSGRAEQLEHQLQHLPGLLEVCSVIRSYLFGAVTQCALSSMSRSMQSCMVMF